MVNQQMDGDDMAWFRWDNTSRHNRKLRALPVEGRWLYVSLCEIASELKLNGVVHVVPGVKYSDDQLADESKVPLDRIRPCLEAMKTLQLIEEDGDGLFVTSFAERQYQSDSSAERTKAYRHRKSTNGDGVVTVCDGHSDDVVTPPDTDTDTDTDIKHTEIVSLWNEICSSKLPSVTSLTPTRQKHLKARLSTKGRDLAWWRTYFARIVNTPFLTGKSAKEWKANFDFAIRSEDVVAKILEGQYGEVGGTPIVAPTKPWDRVYRPLDEFTREG